MNKKRIVFLFRDMGTGGAQKIEAFVANALMENGYEVIAVNMASTACSVNIDPQIKIVDLVYNSASISNPLFSIIDKVKYLIKMRKLLISLKPDLVCAFLSDVVRIAALALQGSSIPLIGSERGDPFTFTQKQFEKYRKAYMNCKGVIFQLDNVATKYDLPENVKQKVIPNPCIPRKTDYSVRSGDIKPVIISAGRLSEQKRFDVLIRAFEIVYQNHPEYELCIYGDGPLRNKLEQQANASIANSAITFAGNVDDVFNIAKDSAFFVLSSDFEGIPNVLLEAMACGMACVATDCSPGGARYLLEDGQRGLIVPCGNTDALAEAMMTYIAQPELRISHEKKGLRAVENFAPQHIKKMWVDFFEDCL